MARMTQTPTITPQRPDSDAAGVRTPDPDGIGTRTQTATPDRDYSDPDPRSDSDPGPGLSPGPNGPDDRTRTRDPDPDPDETTINPGKIGDGPGPGPDTARTRTRTRTGLDRKVSVLASLAGTVDYPGNWLARRRAAAEARRRATETAIRQGAEVELLLIEAKAERDLVDDDETPARWEQFAAGWPQVVLTIAVAIMASVGQIQFAKENGAVGMIWLFGRDITPLFAPAVLDLSVAALYARGMYVAVRHKASPWLPWIAGTAIGIFSVYTNTKHQHGALLFAGASAVGVICWIVALLLKYWALPHVKERRAGAKPRLLTSSLVFASRATATRAWTISRRRPIATCVRNLAAAGKVYTERDLVIRAAELYNTVNDDRRVAELAALTPPPAKTAGKEAMRAWRARRDQALKAAEIVAWDAVDTLLGLEVVEREGIQVKKVRYVEPDPEPVKAVRRPAPVIATAAAPAAPALPASRRRPAAPGTDLELPTGRENDGEVVVVVGKPSGMAGKNWLPLSQIPGLPPIDPTLRCECHTNPTKRCGRTLAEHVARRGVQIRVISLRIGDWLTRPGNITKPDVESVGIDGSGTQVEIAAVLNQVRALPRPAVAAEPVGDQDAS